MNNIIDLGKEGDPEGCVCAPMLLKEMMASNPDISGPVMTMLGILGELARFTLRTNSHELRILALRLGLFPMPREELEKALSEEAKAAIASKKRREEAKNGGSGDSTGD